MSDSTTQRRLGRAKERATTILVDTGHDIIPSDNSTFCILGVREKEIRMIRVVVDEITDNDIEAVLDFHRRPGICTKEIWCKKCLYHRMSCLNR